MTNNDEQQTSSEAVSTSSNDTQFDNILFNQIDEQGDEVQKSQSPYQWDEQIPETIKAKFKTPQDLAKAYLEIEQNSIPPQNGKYVEHSNQHSIITSDYINAMQQIMSKANLSKAQGANLLTQVEEFEQEKLTENCKQLSQMFGSDDEVVKQLQTFTPIIRDKFGKSGAKVLDLIKQVQYDPYLVDFVLQSAKAFKTDKHISGLQNTQGNKESIKQEINKKWSDPNFRARYQRNDAESVAEIDALYNKIYK